MGRKKSKRALPLDTPGGNDVGRNLVLLQSPDYDPQSQQGKRVKLEEDHISDLNNTGNTKLNDGILLKGYNDVNASKPTLVKEEDVSSKSDKMNNASSYSVRSHSGEIVPDDIYVSEGEEENESEVNQEDGSADAKNNSVEVILTSSRMGLMRSQRILGLSSIGGKSNQWVRGDPTTTTELNTSDHPLNDNETDNDNEFKVKSEEEDASNPVRKLEQLKINARRLESAENAGRDPCLFSKRTAFDIRMDQIEDKPWARNNNGAANDITDYFNYGLTEEDWLEYAERQLTVRQELTDSARQKRLPDPTIVPVLPKTPSKQNPKVAVNVVTKDNENESDSPDGESPTHGNNSNILVGPTLPTAPEQEHVTKKEAFEDKSKEKPLPPEQVAETKESPSLLNIAGAWGAGVANDSILAKLIHDSFAPRIMPPIMKQIPPPPPPPPQPKVIQQPQKQQHTPIQQQQQQQLPPPPPQQRDEKPSFPPPPPQQRQWPNQYQRPNFHQGRGRGRIPHFHHHPPHPNIRHPPNPYGNFRDPRSFQNQPMWDAARGRGRGGGGGHYGPPPPMDRKRPRDRF